MAQLDVRQKLAILADVAKYDASGASSGTEKRDSPPRALFLLRVRDDREAEYARFVDDLRRIGNRAEALA